MKSWTLMPPSSYSWQILTDLLRKGRQFKLRPHSPLKVLQQQNVFLQHQEDCTEQLLFALWALATSSGCAATLCPCTCDKQLAVTAGKGTYIAHTYLTSTKHLHNKQPKTPKPKKAEESPPVFKCLCDSNPSSFFMLLTRIPNWDTRPLIFYHPAWLIRKTEGNTHCHASPLGLICEWNFCSPRFNLVNAVGITCNKGIGANGWFFI